MELYYDKKNNMAESKQLVAVFGRREYGQFNLDELAEGDRIGMMRRSNGNLHYFINGQDQGVAASRVNTQVDKKDNI